MLIRARSIFLIFLLLPIFLCAENLELPSWEEGTGPDWSGGTAADGGPGLLPPLDGSMDTVDGAGLGDGELLGDPGDSGDYVASNDTDYFGGENPCVGDPTTCSTGSNNQGSQQNTSTTFIGYDLDDLSEQVVAVGGLVDSRIDNVRIVRGDTPQASASSFSGGGGTSASTQSSGTSISSLDPTRAMMLAVNMMSGAFTDYSGMTSGYGSSSTSGSFFDTGNARNYSSYYDYLVAFGLLGTAYGTGNFGDVADYGQQDGTSQASYNTNFAGNNGSGWSTGGGQSFNAGQGGISGLLGGLGGLGDFSGAFSGSGLTNILGSVTDIANIGMEALGGVQDFFTSLSEGNFQEGLYGLFGADGQGNGWLSNALITAGALTGNSDWITAGTGLAAVGSLMQQPGGLTGAAGGAITDATGGLVDGPGALGVVTNSTNLGVGESATGLGVRIDTDGSVEPPFYDPHYQDQLSDGSGADANTDHYAVVPIGSSIPLGSQIRITNNTTGRSVLATVRDRGPTANGLGEISLAAARDLGAWTPGMGNAARNHDMTWTRES